MTLVFDNREALASGPGLHALIIGISDYPHLPEGKYADAKETFGFSGGLAAAATSALHFHRWLCSNQGHFPVPLATVRLLVSPVDSERNLATEVGGASHATSLEMRDASRGWRVDASAHPDGMTIFYYCGYGIGTRANDVYLLLEDFGDPQELLLRNTASFWNLFRGMGVSDTAPEMARTQLYFVDTLRAVPNQLFPSEPPPLMDVSFGRRDDRAAPVFFSAVPGGLAYARAGEGGCFTRALLAGLDGDAAEPTGESGGSRRLWQVSVTSLARHLEGGLDRLARVHGVDQQFSLEGLFKDVPIVFREETPKGQILVFGGEPVDKAPAAGLHALIAGVSSYLHLPGGASREARLTLGLKQLSAAALSAYRVYEWLMKRASALAVPLASVRLVVSPSLAEVESESGLRDKDPCTLGKFLAAATEWRKDAAMDPENMTFFYFAGHGAQRTKGDTVLLMEDFGDQYGGLLKNAIDFRSVFEGMAPSSDFGRIARKQLYFLDTCRTRPDDFKHYERMPATQAFDIELISSDDRKAPVFYAAVPGSSAYLRSGKSSLFASAMLTALESVFSEETPTRAITAGSLCGDIDAYLEGQEDSDQEFTLEGRTKGGENLVICR